MKVAGSQTIVTGRLGEEIISVGKCGPYKGSPMTGATPGLPSWEATREYAISVIG